MALTMIESDLLARYPEAWLHQLQEREILQHLSECDCGECDPHEDAYRLDSQGFPVRVERY